MYDVKYAPFADSYIGMAHGDTYEHVKRWLKQRFTFVDTLFDYAPSYNNDVLTIRANTTELMTLEIETYTPVYQHLSWYNGQMDKKKIDGKVSVEFSGTAQAATDQEVLIYGGSNVKSIKGITSMNPNRMLIGSATKLVEIDAHDCPLLADINANKANLSPHEYLNKVNLSNCPLLEGNLRLNNSPLVQEINIKGTNITGMNLPSSIRNLQVLRLPNTITELTLNDAGMLHTLDFDEGINLQSVSMTNCNALENVTGLDLLQTPSITLNNSYNTVAELYFRDTTNLSLSNMSNLERVIFTPNNEYETFELINVANAPDYKVTTFNCPKLSTFMTTAPYRESYNNGDYGDIQPNTTFTANSIDISNTQFTDIKLLCTTDTNTLKLPSTVKNFYCDSSFDLDTDYLEDGEYDVVHGELVEPYTTDYEVHRDKRVTESISWNAGNFNTIYPSISHGDNYSEKFYIQEGSVYTVSCSPSGDFGSWFKAFGFNNSDTVIWQYGGSSTSDTTGRTGTIPSGVVYVRFARVGGNPVDITYTTDATGEVQIIESKEKNTPLPNLTWTHTDYALSGGGELYISSGCKITDFIEVTPSTTVSMTNGEGTSYNFQCICYYDENKNYLYGENWIATVSLPSNAHYIRFSHRTVIATDSSYTVVYSQPVIYTPNLIPSSADGSLIFSMYAPSNTVAPQNGTWDLKGLEFDNFHTYGMNNDVKGGYEGWVYNRTSLKSDNGCAIEDFVKIQFERNASELINHPFTIYYNSKRYNMYLDETNIYHLDKTTPLYMYNKIGEEGIYEVCIDLINLTIEFYGITIPLSKLYSATSDTTNKFVIYNTDFDVYLREFIPLTMPSRYDDYNITIKNAYIAPKTHNTMLYPLLVNEDNPITGTLDYTNYAGKHLSWSFAYTDEEYVNITQPKDELLNSYEYRYNAFYDTEYEFDNPYEIARYTSSASGVFPTFNSEFTYTYDEIDNGDGTYTTKIYADSLDNLPTSISFRGKTTLLTVDKLNTSKVTSMYLMFRDCVGLTSLDASNWNTSNVTNMNSTFFYCKNLTSLDISNWDTSNVTYMNNMFQYCENLTSLDISNWDTSNVTNMNSMFSGCKALTTLDVSGFDTSNVTDIGDMFRDCVNLTDVNVTGLCTSKITNLSLVFYGCLKLVNIVGLNTWDTSNVTKLGEPGWQAAGIFQLCESIESLDLSSWDLTKVVSFDSAFCNCKKLQTLKIDFTGVAPTNLNKVFCNCYELSTLEGIETIDTSNVTTLQSAFHNCNLLTSLNVSKWSTPNVTNMVSVFYNCSSLTSLNLSSWNTNSVTNMSGMFYNCSGLTSLDVSGFDTKNVINMSNMFNGCSSLISLDLSSFDTVNVTNMSSMFQSCTNLTTLDVSGFDTKNVIYMASMFRYCNSIRTLSLDNFDTSKVTDMSYMFQSNTQLEALDLSAWNVDKVTNFREFITLCGKLISLNLSNWSLDNVNTIIPQLRVNSLITSTLYGTVIVDESTLPSGWVYYNALVIAKYTANATGVRPTFNGEFTYTYDEIDNGDGTYTTKIYADSLDNLPTSINFSYKSRLKSVERLNTLNVTDMKNMFYNCTGLTSIDLSGFDTSKVTNMYGMFRGCGDLTSLDVSGFKTGKVTDMGYMFYGCSGLTSLDVSGFKTGKVTDMSFMFYGCNQLTSLDVSGFDTSKVTNMNSMFYNCSKPTSLDVSGFDTDEVIDMSFMFRGCSKLTSLDVSGFKTGKVTTMSYMFYNCNKLTTLDVSGFDTSNVTDMYGMFNACYTLTSLDVSGFKTSKVGNMSYMFYNCNSLTTLDVSGFETGNVTTMSSMFTYCNQLTSLDVSGFETGNVTSMYGMFNGCIKLTSLDVSGLETSKVGNMGSMFSGCNNLTSLDVSEFKTSNVTDMNSMFDSCNRLTSLDVSGFDTGKVTDMSCMFSGCRALISLDLSGFDTSNVTNMDSMFQICSQLTSLDSMQNISAGLSLSGTKLDVTSLLDVIDNLATVSTSKTLTLGSTLLAKLTEEQIAIAVNKGWTLV